MKIQIASDLHLGHSPNRNWLRKNPILPRGELLILAGDTVPYIHQGWADSFYNEISENFEQVISIFGNHEFYQGEINISFPTCEKQIRDNIILLNNVSMEWKGVRFICTTLWSDVPLSLRTEVQEIMNDYYLIKKRTIFKELVTIQVEDTLNYYHYSLEYLKKELDKYKNEKVVVITHHVPVYGSLPETYLKSVLKYSYGNDLDELIISNPQICLWVCGHCHYPDERMIGKTLLVRNPLGYVIRGQQKNFRPDYIVEI
jgi:hypothetical protein